MHTELFIMNINPKITPRKAVADSQIHFFIGHLEA